MHDLTKRILIFAFGFSGETKPVKRSTGYKVVVSPRKSAPVIPSSHERDALQAKMPGLAHQQTRINALSHAVLFGCRPPENVCSVAAKKPKQKQKQRHNVLADALSLEMGLCQP
jgi:hypothetical protein